LKWFSMAIIMAENFTFTDWWIVHYF